MVTIADGLYDPTAGRIMVGSGAVTPADKTLQMQLAALKAQIASANKTIAKLQASAKNEKDKKRKGRIEAQIKLHQGRVKQYTTNMNATQNKIYENTGQYDKLLTGANRDAFMALNAMFDQYDLGSLAGKIYDYVKNGYSADTISILLQDTAEYKDRFKANEARRKAGMQVLSPAEYLSIESSYRQIMRQSGLPTGFYDNTDDFTKFISGDMSPTELQGRVDLATQASVLANDTYKAALKQMGIGQGDVAAYFLDPARATPLLQKAAATAAIGAEAMARGLQFDSLRAEQLATSGVGREQAASGFAQIADEFSDLKSLASIYGGSWSQSQAEQDVFVGGGAASQQRKSLISNEKASFSGAGGTARSGLAQRGGSR